MKGSIDYNDLKNTLKKKRFLGLLQAMGGFRILYVIATLCIGLSAAAKTGTFYLIRYFVDDILSQSQMTNLIPLVAFSFVGLALIQGLGTYMGGRIAGRTSEGIVKRIRDYLYDHIQRLTYTYHDHTPTGDLIQRATSDIDAVRRFFAQQAVSVGRILFLFLINFTALLTLHVRLALLSVVVVPVILLVSIIFSKWIARVYDGYQKQEANLSTTLQENLSGIRVVKAFGRWDYEKEKFEKENSSKYRKGKALIVAHTFFWPTSDLLCAGQMMAGFILAALMVIRGEISLGTYLAYHGMLIHILWPMRGLGRIIVQMATGLVSFGRIQDVVAEEREPLHQGIHVPEEPIKGDIVFDRVSFEYEKDAPVLHEVSFRCSPGQIVALLGPPGSGKSTLVNLLPRFYDYSSGRILLDGKDLNEIPRLCLRKSIGIVEQEPFLFSRSIRENITYGVDVEVPDEDVQQMAGYASIHDVINGFPASYETLVGEKGVTLSGGQKQRLAIARTLLKDPRILILDDSTSSVDTETEMAIKGSLQRLMKGRTTFIIAHRIQSLMMADLILVLDQGRLVQQGTHEQLVREEGFYRKIYDIQSQVEEEIGKEQQNASV